MRVFRKPEAIANIPILESTNAPSNLDVGGSNTVGSRIFAGHWPHMLVGFRLRLNVKVSTERYLDNFQTAFLASMRVDAQPLQEKSFGLIDEATSITVT